MEDENNELEDGDLMDEDQLGDESDTDEDDAILHEKNESRLPRDDI